MSFVPPGPACFKTLADSGQPCQPEVETERLHVPDEPALPVTDGGEKLRKLPWVPVEPGPVLKLMDIHSPHRLRRLWPRFAAGTSQKTRRGRGGRPTGLPPRNLLHVELYVDEEVAAARRGREGITGDPEALLGGQDLVGDSRADAASGLGLEGVGVDRDAIEGVGRDSHRRDRDPTPAGPAAGRALGRV